VILVDSSVWIEHLRRSNEILTDLLDRQQVLMHPFVVGELALGHLRPRNMVLGVLQVLDQVIVARDDEVMRLIDEERLFAIGLGYVDAHLLASVRLTPGTFLWTRDKRLSAAAERLSLGARVTH
jgi:predicted nucleic acid-binding protein